LADLVEELTEILVGGFEEFLPSEFNADRFLQQLGRGKTAILHCSIEIFGEVDLHPWHTPKHTHLAHPWEPQESTSFRFAETRTDRPLAGPRCRRSDPLADYTGTGAGDVVHDQLTTRAAQRLRPPACHT
jgi:hypothetical protein